MGCAHPVQSLGSGLGIFSKAAIQGFIWLSLAEPQSLIPYLVRSSIWGKSPSWRILEGRLGAGFPAGVCSGHFSLVVFWWWIERWDCPVLEQIPRAEDFQALWHWSSPAKQPWGSAASLLSFGEQQGTWKNESSPGTKSFLLCWRRFCLLVGALDLWCCACSPLKAQVIWFEVKATNPRGWGAVEGSINLGTGGTISITSHTWLCRSWDNSFCCCPKMPFFQPENEPFVHHADVPEDLYLPF